jgi:hypothetical protein
MNNQAHGTNGTNRQSNGGNGIKNGIMSGSFQKNENGFWEKDGQVFYHIAQIKPDKCLKSLLVRELFEPHTLVVFFPETGFKDEDDHGEKIYFISVMPVQGIKEMEAIPLCMLDLSPDQRSELMKFWSVPKWAFEKLALTEHAEKDLSDDENPAGVIRAIESNYQLEFALL